jgi:transmembrane sensor
MNPQVLEAAADWFIRVRSTKASAEEHVAWLNWIESDPAHRQAFEEIQKAWDVAGGVQRKTPRRSALATRLALAASVLVAFGLAFFLFAGGGSVAKERLATGRGEQQSAVLPDGSKVELGGLTGITVSYTDKQRLIVADEGETFYKVARDAGRPFVVRTGPISVTALGTAFSVRREGASVAVAVTDGLVEVKTANADAPAVRAGAGEWVRFDNGMLARRSGQIQTEVARAWRRGTLRFEEEPLRVVAANLNRYSQREIEITDPQLAELKFTGTVFDDRVDDWLKGVQVAFPVRVREVSERRVIIERAR